MPSGCEWRPERRCVIITLSTCIPRADRQCMDTLMRKLIVLIAVLELLLAQLRLIDLRK